MSTSKVRLSITTILAVVLTLTSQWPAQSQTTAAPSAQAVSQTGLLPVYGIDFVFDPSWVDAAQFPSQSAANPNFGTTQTFQQVWDALKPSGFNVLRFSVDVRDAQGSVNRFANLCLWAQNNNVRLVPILTGGERGKSLGPDFSTHVSAFIKGLIAAFSANGGQNLKAYSQILAYQLEDEMNHAGRHGAMSQEAAQLRVLQAAGAVHKTEQDALKDSGLNLTPVMVNASFDYELIKLRAIAGTPLGDEAYGKAYASLKQFLSELASSSDVDLIGLDWFAGSISAGGVDKFATLLRSLTADFPGKQIVFTTGFSTAFASADEQKRFYALTFANLADFHVSEGVDAPFVGVFYHEALTAGTNNPTASNFAADMSKWDWGSRADELAQMWSGGASSDVMTKWLQTIETNMGLILMSPGSSGSVITQQPAQSGLTQIANTVSQAETATAASAAVTPDPNTANSVVISQPTSTSQSSPSFDQALKQKAQEALMSVLDRVFQQLANSVNADGVTNNSGSATAVANNDGQPVQPNSASLALARENVIINPVAPHLGDQVTLNVTVRNQSPNADAANLVMALVDDASNALAQTTGAAVGRNGSQNFSLQWTPTEAKSYPLSVVVADANLNVLASAALDPIVVAAATNSSGTSSGTQSGMPGTFKRDLGKLLLPLGSPRVQHFTTGQAGRSLVAGEASSVGLSLTNPYTRSLTNVKATLLIDGREAQAKVVGSLLPGQSRSLLFTNTTIPQAGRHEVKVVLETREARLRKGFVTTQVDVVASRHLGATDAGATKPLPQRSVLPGRINVGGVAVTLNQSARMSANPNDSTTGLATGRRIRPITNTRVAASKQPDRQTASGAATIATNSNGNDSVLRTKPLPTPEPIPAIRGHRHVFPGINDANRPLPRPDLSVSPNDISYRPDAPKLGGQLTLSASIHNMGMAKAQQARITCVLLVDGRALALRDFVADIAVNSVYVVRWNVATPAGRRVRFEVSVSVDGDTDPRNNSTGVDINLANNTAPVSPIRRTPH